MRWIPTFIACLFIREASKGSLCSLSYWQDIQLIKQLLIVDLKHGSMKRKLNCLSETNYIWYLQLVEYINLAEPPMSSPPRTPPIRFKPENSNTRKAMRVQEAQERKRAEREAKRSLYTYLIYSHSTSFNSIFP